MTKMTDMRAEATALFQAAIEAADPARAVTRALKQGPLRAEGTLFLIAVGKAAVPMMRAALAQVDAETQVEALVVTNPENAAPVEGARVLQSSHPVPDEAGERAALALEAMLSGTTQRDRVIALISGGGSALLPAPAKGITLAEKARVNSVLLGSGLDINDMNHIRQQISRLKGGGLLATAAPAPVTAYILSDVVGDDLRAIASGPTVAPIGTRASAKALLERANIWDDMPASVQAHLEHDAPETPRPPAENHLVASNRQSLDAMRAACPEAQIINDRLEGNVADVAPNLAEIFRALPEDAPAVLLFGGETTVTLTGDGKGGRNQDLALRISQEKIAGEWVFLSGGTDGRDGPTDAAGGLVDTNSAARMTAAGIDAKARLDNNDAYAALEASGDLLMTGGTGTNVADVQIFIRR
ncbi:glycerate kinase type-2 family protein [Litoreibacter albidus]|uniref:glycerate kinase type-2 family protein n=1 Tax=Litoreibacter albidus TaxID=670155 RepID=UPI003735C44B